MNSILVYLAENPWLVKIIKIAVFFIVAFIIQRSAGHLVRPLTGLLRLRPGVKHNPERRATLNSLFASGIGMLIYLVAIIFSIGQYVSADTLIWIVGLFSAAFGFAMRPLISDILTGISFIFEDTFSVGEKVELLEIEGMIEAINLRTSLLRSPSGELYVIPNGEIRMVRNFSRGRFSTTNVYLKIASSDLSRTLEIMDELGKEAVLLLPNLIEPWHIISEGGVLGHQTQLTVLAKARFGKAAEMRPKMLALIHERLADAGIHLVD
ncbi:MAG: hypothetical protein BGO78_06975 [Chloroflexi bacterium 44-23]|nr:MAG: hypothetical protein BGO78_06975 [Chloroflexi bacterium 44-23]